MYYAAYGSNMNLAQMAHRCPKSHVVGNAILTGWKLVFNFHADIVYTGKSSDSVPVVLWNIHKDDWKSLDMYEGYPTYYTMEAVLVDLEGEDFTQAVVYVMADHRKGISVPTESYFNVILEGYKDNGIDTSPLYDALQYAEEHKTIYNQYNPKGGFKFAEKI